MAGIPEEKIAEIRDAADIVEVISSHVALKKAGANFRGLCPFHQENTPSFMVSPAKQIYHCFGCGEGGNVFQFLMKMENLSFGEVVKQLAERSGISLPDYHEGNKDKAENELLFEINKMAAGFFSRNLLENRKGQAWNYLQKRGVTENIIERFGLGLSFDEWDGLLQYAAKQKIKGEMLEKAGLALKRKEGSGYYDRFRARLMFPIGNYGGRIIGFGGRSLDNSEPKYMNSPETPLYRKNRNLYAWHLAKDDMIKKGVAILVEGYFDAITAHQYGFSNTVAGLGTALTTEQARLLRRWVNEVIIAYDVDKAGQAASLRGYDILIEQGLKVSLARMPEGKDPDEFLRHAGAAGFEKAMKNSVNLIDYKLQFLGKVTDPSAKAKVINELASTLAKIPSETERAEYARQLDEKLLSSISTGVESKSQREILSVIQKIKPSAGYFPKTVALAGRPGQAKTTREKAERDLLRLMLGNSEISRLGLDRLEHDDFHDSTHAELFQWLKKHAVLPEQSDLAKLVGESKNGLKQLITGLLMEQREYELPVKVAGELVKFIGMSEEKKRYEELRRKIKTKTVNITEVKEFHGLKKSFDKKN